MISVGVYQVFLIEEPNLFILWRALTKNFILADRVPINLITEGVNIFPNVSDKLQHYDLGFNRNIKKYGQSKPPEYDLRKVTSPVVLYYSKNDRVVDSGVRFHSINSNYIFKN